MKAGGKELAQADANPGRAALDRQNHATLWWLRVRYDEVCAAERRQEIVSVAGLGRWEDLRSIKAAV